MNNNKPEILVIDDTPENLRLLMDIMTREGYKVRPAVNGELALQALRYRIPDLVLLDIRMPEMDGFDFFSHFREYTNDSDIPVIFITADNNPENIRRCFSIGGADFIRKPINPDEVIHRVKNQLQIRRLHDQLEKRNRNLQDAADILELKVWSRTDELEETISQLRHNREELLQAEKMASLGVLTTGIAHEINNPNQAISSSAQHLFAVFQDTIPFLDKYYNDEGDFIIHGRNYSEIRDDLYTHYERIINSSRRISKIVGDLKNYARREPYTMNSRVQVNDVVESGVSLMESFIKRYTSRFLMNLDNSIPEVRGSYQKLEQVFINLLQNSCQALTSTDQAITVATSFAASDNLVLLTIEDEGRGIPANNLSRIEDPFFTTRQKEGGTGLGLSISTGIIKDHRGTIRFRSEEPKGTKVFVYLPAEKMNGEGNN